MPSKDKLIKHRAFLNKSGGHSSEVLVCNEGEICDDDSLENGKAIATIVVG